MYEYEYEYCPETHPGLISATGRLRDIGALLMQSMLLSGVKRSLESLLISSWVIISSHYSAAWVCSGRVSMIYLGCSRLVYSSASTIDVPADSDESTRDLVSIGSV